MSDERDDTVSLESLLERFRAGLQEELHTALPGRVESYDASAQVADITPMIRRAVPRADGGVLREQMPTLRAVPVVWPRTGAWFVHMPVAAGDTVLLVVLERDPARWRVTGELSDPLDRRAHHLSHAVAIPGLFPRSGKLPPAATPSDALVIGRTSGASIRVRDDGVVVIDAEEVQVAGTSALTIAPELAEHLTAIAADLTSIAVAAGTTATNYGTLLGKPGLDLAHPIAAQKAKGS